MKDDSQRCPMCFKNSIDSGPNLLFPRRHLVEGKKLKSEDLLDLCSKALPIFATLIRGHFFANPLFE
jgi:hypothetical protein